ncbi:MAG: hypothetical protein ACREX0_10330 [Noviherbaspirillum sp.]
METIMKTDMLHRSDSAPRAEDEQPAPQKRGRSLTIGKTLALIAVLAFAASASQAFYRSVNERFETERQARLASSQFGAIYSVDFWNLVVLHTR